MSWKNFVLVLTVIMCLISLSADGSPAPKPAVEQPVVPVEVEGVIDKSQVKVGEQVWLRELIRKQRKARVLSISHEVSEFGRFDPRAKSQMSLGGSITSPILDGCNILFADDVFEGLPFSRRQVEPRVMPFDLSTDTDEGYELFIRARRPGIYLIVAEWMLDNNRAVSSQPVVVRVLQ